MQRVMKITGNSQVCIDEDGTQASIPTDDEFLWVDIQKPDEAWLQSLAEEFQFHALTIEDCLHFDQRPKLESYDGYLFLVIQGFRVDWEQLENSDAVELHLFIAPNYLVTVHDEPIAAIDSVWRRIASDGRLSESRGDYMAYLIADVLIDSYFPILDEIELRLDHVEDRILTTGEDVSLEEILDFKRLLVSLRRILSPQRDVLSNLARRGDSLVSDRVTLYFRDVYDHTLRIHESIEAARELLANVRDGHLWSLSQRTNEIMKRLTVLSAVFMPLTFITGFF
ncbi:MAG: magnesium/cobalt transporter CorA, partial [Planctomycetaceae bacterium]|nr:magnesium/cobalt transporter CorA [Planctomycetaceae bacterium]